MKETASATNARSNGAMLRDDVPPHARTFYEDAKQRLKSLDLEPQVRNILERRCEEIEEGKYHLDPDETVHMIFERFSD